MGSLQPWNHRAPQIVVQGSSHLKTQFLCVSCSVMFDSTRPHGPGFSVRGLFQARILEWVAISSSRRSSLLRDQTRVSGALLSLLLEPTEAIPKAQDSAFYPAPQIEGNGGSERGTGLGFMQVRAEQAQNPGPFLTLSRRSHCFTTAG